MNRFLALLVAFLVMCVATQSVNGALISSVDAAKEIYNQTNGSIAPTLWITSGDTIDAYASAGIRYNESTSDRTFVIGIYQYFRMPALLKISAPDCHAIWRPIICDVKYGPFTVTTTKDGNLFTEIADIGNGRIQVVRIDILGRTPDRFLLLQPITLEQVAAPQEWTDFVNSTRPKTLY